MCGICGIMYSIPCQMALHYVAANIEQSSTVLLDNAAFFFFCLFVFARALVSLK